jgi:hypothetical protein
MNKTISQVVQQLEVLPSNLQEQVLNFVQSLSHTVPVGVPGKTLLQFAGFFPADDLQLMQNAIEEDCAQVDLDEW